MSLLDALKKAFAQPAGRTAAREPVSTSPTGPEEISVPEVTAAELMAEMRNVGDAKPFLLDCREHYERRQAHIPDNLHIPMNSIPHRLGEIDRHGDIVVYCAHGNRSYGVAGWLIQQGFQARSLKGGIVDWQVRGGEVKRGG